MMNSLKITFRKAETKKEKLLLALAVLCAFGLVAAFVFVPDNKYPFLKAGMIFIFAVGFIYGFANSTMTPSKKQQH